MDPRTLLLRKNDVDTALVQPVGAHASATGGGPGTAPENSVAFRLGLRVLPGKKRHVRFLSTDPDEGEEAGAWPDRTDLLCWHCCHPFDGPPLPMPVAHDDRRDVFRVMGCFCSWACMKTYNGADNSYLKNARASLITLFRKRATGALGRLGSDGRLEGHVVSAPPRAMLRAFGGTLTIEEFRATSADGKAYRFLPPKLVLHDPFVEERRTAPKPPPDLRAAVSFGATTQNETLRLKRPKPLVAHNMLERTMGLTIL